MTTARRGDQVISLITFSPRAPTDLSMTDRCPIGSLFAPRLDLNKRGVYSPKGRGGRVPTQSNVKD